MSPARRGRLGLAVLLLAFTSRALLVASEPAAEAAIQAPLAPRSLLTDGAAVGRRCVVVGERGHILVSRDGGESWHQVEVPTRTLLTGVWMHDERLGWAVGHDEVILRTRDGGESWELVHSAPDNERPLLDVWFADSERGLALGSYGALLTTADGGATWESGFAGEDDFHLNQVARAPDGTLYLAAEAGHLYRSDDTGATWQPLASPYEGSFFGVLPLADGALLAFGLRGHLFRSEDRGATWRQLDTGSEATLTSALELPGGRVVVAGMAGVLLESADGGRSFALRELADRKGAAAVLPRPDGGFLLLGEGGIRRPEERP